MTDLKEQIIALAEALNIQKIGFTTADDFEHLRASLLQQKEKGHTSGFEHQNLDERLNPKLSLKEAKTIISIAIAYPSRLEMMPKKTQNKRGSFARASWGIDYHALLEEKMQALARGIEELAGQFDYKGMVDTGALIDVAVAARSGLGFVGKNGLLISKEYGSWLYLGELVTNLDLEADAPVDYGCGNCTRCLDFCPTGALIGEGQLNAKRCLSFQTQNKGDFPEEMRKAMKTTIYGCDICQLVCPYNKGIDNHFHTEMEEDPNLSHPELIPFIGLSSREFKTKYGHMAGAWRGHTPLQRNAIYALTNIGNRKVLPVFRHIAQTDSRENIRAAAQWGIEQLTKTSSPSKDKKMGECPSKD